MDAGKEQIFEERKALRAKVVNIIFPTNDGNFNVVDDEGNLKYSGIVQGPEPHIDDNCTCPNFIPLNNEKWISAHGYAYQCKHLIAAREQKFQ